MWGHTRKNCFQEHPELHPANRSWAQEQLAILEQPVDNQNAAHQNEEAHVMDEYNLEEHPFEEHPFKLNMVMTESISVVRDLPQDNSKDPHKSDIPRCWLINSGASSYYIQNPTKFRSYQWLQRPIRIGT